MDILFNALIISLTVYFLKATTWPGMIFESVGNFTERLLGEHLNKPILGCPVCMTPWWGSLIYFLAYYFRVPNFHPYQHVIPIALLTVSTAAGINTVILMLNKEYDVAKKEEKLLKKELDNEHIK